MRKTPRWFRLKSVVLSCVVAGGVACASTPKSAEEHRELAASEQAQSAEHMSRYDESARAVALSRSETDPNALVTEEYNPTHFEKAAADAHARAADRHRAAARALEESEDAACAGTSAAERSACPLLLPTSVTDVSGGVRVTFSDAATATRAGAVIRCQQAFATTRGFRDLPTCAIYARKLQVTQEGATLELDATDAADVARLRANVRGHHAE